MGDVVRIERPNWGPPTAAFGGRDTPGDANLFPVVAEPRKDPKTDDTGLVPADGSGLPAELLASWSKQGGVDYHLRQVQAAGQALLGSLGAEERQSLVATFDGLS